MPSHPTSWKSILILCYRLRVVLPSCLFPSGLPTKTLVRISPASYACHMPAHLIILLDSITWIILDDSASNRNKFVLPHSQYPAIGVGPQPNEQINTSKSNFEANFQVMLASILKASCHHKWRIFDVWQQNVCSLPNSTRILRKVAIGRA